MLRFKVLHGKDKVISIVASIGDGDWLDYAVTTPLGLKRVMPTSNNYKLLQSRTMRNDYVLMTEEQVMEYFQPVECSLKLNDQLVDLLGRNFTVTFENKVDIVLQSGKQTTLYPKTVINNMLSKKTLKRKL